MKGKPHKDFRVELITVNADPSAIDEIQTRGSYLIGPKFFDHIVSFGHGDAKTNANVTIIVGIHSEKSVHYLLLCRFWKAIAPLPSKAIVNQFLMHSVGMTEINNIKKKQTGGSSGMTTHNSSAYHKLMSQSGTCPRNRKGMFVIPHGTQVTVAYMNAKGNATIFAYLNPVHEGGGDQTDLKLIFGHLPFSA